jgi:hypothetical protein
VLVNSSSDEEEESDGERTTSNRWEPALPSPLAEVEAVELVLRWVRSRPPPGRRWRRQQAPRRHRRAQRRCLPNPEGSGSGDFPVCGGWRFFLCTFNFEGQPLTLNLLSLSGGRRPSLNLTPVKVLKLRTSATTGRRSERVPREAASAAVAGKVTHITTAAARPQQEGMAVAASQALLTV